MFTGLVQTTGKIRRVSRGRGLVVEIETDAPWSPPLAKGEFVAVDGVCLTVVACGPRRFTADVLSETEERSGLGGAVPGTRVNLERALRAGDPMGGHVVQGHVDARGTIASREPRGRDFRLRVSCGPKFAAYCVEKGSVAIDGVSLTITGCGKDWFSVDLVPSTAAATTLGAKRTGDKVNLESDVLCRMAAARAAGGAAGDDSSGGGLTLEALAAAGFV